MKSNKVEYFLISNVCVLSAIFGFIVYLAASAHSKSNNNADTCLVSSVESFQKSIDRLDELTTAEKNKCITQWGASGYHPAMFIAYLRDQSGFEFDGSKDGNLKEVKFNFGEEFNNKMYYFATNNVMTAASLYFSSPHYEDGRFDNLKTLITKYEEYYDEKSINLSMGKYYHAIKLGANMRNAIHLMSLLRSLVVHGNNASIADYKKLLNGLDSPVILNKEYKYWRNSFDNANCEISYDCIADIIDSKEHKFKENYANTMQSKWSSLCHMMILEKTSTQIIKLCGG